MPLEKSKTPPLTVRDLYAKGVRRFRLPERSHHHWYQIVAGKVLAFDLWDRPKATSPKSNQWSLGPGAERQGGRIKVSNYTLSLGDFFQEKALRTNRKIDEKPISVCSDFLWEKEVLLPLLLPGGLQVDLWVHSRFGKVYAKCGENYAEAVKFMAERGQDVQQNATGTGLVVLDYIVGPTGIICLTGGGGITVADILDFPCLASREIKG